MLCEGGTKLGQTDGAAPCCSLGSVYLLQGIVGSDLGGSEGRLVKGTIQLGNAFTRFVEGPSRFATAHWGRPQLIRSTHKSDFVRSSLSLNPDFGLREI